MEPPIDEKDEIFIPFIKDMLERMRSAHNQREKNFYKNLILGLDISGYNDSVFFESIEEDALCFDKDREVIRKTLQTFKDFDEDKL